MTTVGKIIKKTNKTTMMDKIIMVITTMVKTIKIITKTMVKTTKTTKKTKIRKRIIITTTTKIRKRIITITKITTIMKIKTIIMKIRTTMKTKTTRTVDSASFPRATGAGAGVAELEVINANVVAEIGTWDCNLAWVLMLHIRSTEFLMVQPQNLILATRRTL